MRCLTPSFLLLAAVAHFALPAPSEAGGCGCLDLADLKHRQDEVKIASQSFQSEITNLQNQMLKDGKPTYYTAALAQEMRDRAQGALDRNAAGKLATLADGNTDNLCNIAVNEHATACIQESTRRHEQVHRDACLRTRSVSSVASSISTPGQFKDRFETNHAPLISYAVEETQGYMAEQGFLSTQISALEKSCKQPPAPEVKRDYTSRQLTPNPTGSQGSGQQMKNTVDSFRRLFGK